MFIIYVLEFILVGLFVSIAVEGSTYRPKIRCEYFKDAKGYLVADCTNRELLSIPEIKETDVEV